MDDFESDNLGSQNLDKPIPFDDGAGRESVSHSPLNLGGGGVKQAPKIETPKKPAQKPTQEQGSGGRITGVKTFFTKLHPGAIEFLDEQISNWLKANPGISIKLTNTTTGEVQGKKTEPNIIISVWY